MIQHCSSATRNIEALWVSVARKFQNIRRISVFVVSVQCENVAKYLYKILNLKRFFSTRNFMLTKARVFSYNSTRLSSIVRYNGSFKLKTIGIGTHLRVGDIKKKNNFTQLHSLVDTKRKLFF